VIRWAHRFLVCARAGTNGGSAVQLLASLFRRALCGWQLTSPPKPLMLLHNLPHTAPKTVTYVLGRICYPCARTHRCYDPAGVGNVYAHDRG